MASAAVHLPCRGRWYQGRPALWSGARHVPMRVPGDRVVSAQRPSPSTRWPDRGAGGLVLHSCSPYPVGFDLGLDWSHVERARFKHAYKIVVELIDLMWCSWSRTSCLPGGSRETWAGLSELVGHGSVLKSPGRLTDGRRHGLVMNRCVSRPASLLDSMWRSASAQSDNGWRS